MTQKVTNCVMECSPDRCSLLAQTQQELAEAQARIAALERSEALFRHTFEQAAVGIAQVGLDLHLLGCNQRYSEIIGYTSDEPAQHGVADYTHPDDMEHDRQGARHLLAGEIATYRTQKRYLHKTGEVRWANVTVSLVHTPEGQPDYFISVVEDITQLKQTEAALQRSHERYQRVVDDQIDLICRYNADFQLTFVNQAYCASLDKTPEALAGVNLLTLVPPEESDRLRAKVQALHSANPVAISESSHIIPNGQRHWFEWIDRALCDPDGNIIEYQGVGRDITAQKLLQLEQQYHTQVFEEMHQFLHSTIDAIANSLAVLHPDGTILNVNEHWRRFALLSGAESPTNYIGENYLTVCDTSAGATAAEAAPVAAGIRAVIEGQREHFYLEYPCHSPTKEHWFGVRVMPFAEPPPRRVVVAHLDITERVQAEKAERQQRIFAEGVRDALAALTGAINVEQMLQQILTAASTVVPSEGGSIILFEGEWSRVAYLRGFSAEAVAYHQANRFPLAWFVQDNDVAQGRPYFTPDTQATTAWFPTPGSEWVRSSMGVPITLRGKVIGLLCADSATPNSLQQADFENLQAFAHYAGLALQNAHYLSQLETRVAERTAELQAAKERVEAILNHSFDGILLVRPDLRIEQTNTAFNQMFAGVADDVFAGTLRDLIHLEDVALVQALIERVLARQVGEQIEIRCYQKNGTVFDAELSIGSIKGDGIVCTLRDITERKKTEQALQESQRFSQKITETVPNGIYIFDLQAQRNIYINQNMVRSLGYSVETLQGTGIAFVEQIMHPDDQPLFAVQLQHFIQADDQQILELEYRMRHANGTWHWFLSCDTVFARDEAGRVQQILGVATDITERKQAEAALRESEALYRLLADNITDLVLRFNANLQYIYVSPSCQPLLGYAPEALLAQSALSIAHPDDFNMLMHEFTAAMEQRLTTQVISCRFRHQAGHYLWMECAGQLIYAEDANQMVEIIVSARDITERKRVEDALQRKVEEERGFRNYLQALHEVTMELAATDPMDNFYKRAVELGLARLGFERLGLLLYDEADECIQGTYGTDTAGKVIAEHHARAKVADYPALQQGLNSTEPFGASEDMALYTNYEAAGRGWGATCILRHDETKLGLLTTDNGVRHQPPPPMLADRLALYSLTISTLLARKRLTGALRESQAKFRRLLQVAPVAIVIADQNGQITLVNNQAEKLFGYMPDELLGQPLEILIPEEFHSAHTIGLTTYAPKPNAQPMVAGRDLFGSRKDGTCFPIEIELGSLETAEGLMLMSFITDITERKQTAVALREQRDFLQLIINNVPDLIGVKDGEGRFHLVNAATARLHQLTPAEMIGKRNQEVNPNATEVAFFQQTDQKTLTEGQIVVIPEQTIMGRYYHTTKIPLKNADGKIDRLLIVSFDVTERKAAEAAAREQRDFLQQVIDHIPAIITVRDQAGRYQLLNRQAAELYHVAPERMLGKTVADLYPDANQVASFSQEDQMVLTSGCASLLPEVAALGRYFEVNRIPIKNATGQVDRLLIVSNDITERKKAEAAIRASEHKYRQLVETMQSGLIIFDKNERVTYVNDRFCEMSGYRREELLGLSLGIGAGFQEAVVLQNQFRKRMEGERSAYEFVGRHKNGQQIYLLVSASPLLSDEGDVLGSLAVLVDIGPQKQTEAALRQSEEQYRNLAETMPGGIFIFNINDQATYANDQLCHMLGYPREEILGRLATDFVDAENAEIVRREFSKRKQGESTSYELTMQRKDGRLIHLLVSASPLHNDQQEIIGTLAILLDIETQKQAEAALRQSEQQYRHLVETMRGGLVIYGMDGRAIYANDRLCELLGYARQEILGSTAYKFVDEDNARLLANEFNKRIGGENSAYELLAMRKNGQPIHLLISASPLLNDQHEVIGTVAVLIDIETQKQAEAALRENLQKEKELGELKSRFVSMASHEFRTPLASILALTETLRAYRHKLADEQIDQRLVKIQEQIGYLKGIMEDVLQLARLQARRAEFNPAKLDLDALCRSVLDEFQSNPAHAPRLVYYCDTALQSVVLDKKLIRQVLSNLVSNGLKYSPADKPVAIKLVREEAQLVLTVRDEGIGIPEADLVHLFEPFHRAANVGTISGTGLGLVITKESVELHGGTITVESQISAGTAVIVRIPLPMLGEKGA